VFSVTQQTFIHTLNKI